MIEGAVRDLLAAVRAGTEWVREDWAGMSTMRGVHRIRVHGAIRWAFGG